MFFHSLVYFPNAQNTSGWARLKARSWEPKLVLLRHLLVPPRGTISRKLESGAELWLKSWHPYIASRHPKGHLNDFANIYCLIVSSWFFKFRDHIWTEWKILPTISLSPNPIHMEPFTAFAQLCTYMYIFAYVHT